MTALQRPVWSIPDEPFLALPKVTLHDHIDGSLRMETMLELAESQGVPLPHADPEVLAGWFNRPVDPPEPFPHYRFAVTTSLLQDPESLARVAREWVVEAAADGVRYGEARWAPEKHIAGGMTMYDAVDAVTAGLKQGEAEAAVAGRRIIARQLLCGMRETTLSSEVADVVIATYGDSVVGFDLAGPEEGWPARLHLDAARKLHEAGIPFTFHAGEGGGGVPSIWETVHLAHALRLGHGVQIIEDVLINGRGTTVGTAVRDAAAARAEGRVEFEVGPVARWVLDRGIPLEVCLTSNSRSVVPGRENHPIELLRALGFVVTINPDNRMMSQTSVTAEMRHLNELFEWGMPELSTAILAGVQAAFLHKEEREELYGEVAAALDASGAGVP